MIVVLKSNGHTCHNCAEDKLLLVADMCVPDYEVAKFCGINIVWKCPKCHAKNVSRILDYVCDLYFLKQDTN